jgi:hypothetical protein
MTRTVSVPAGVDPAVYARALADVVALRSYGTYRAKPEKLPPTDDPRCGTRTGYNAHRHRGERACTRCLDANNTATKRIKAQQQTGTGGRRAARKAADA